jgi:hypothetical protein
MLNTLPHGKVQKAGKAKGTSGTQQSGQDQVTMQLQSHLL